MPPKVEEKRANVTAKGHGMDPLPTPVMAILFHLVYLVLPLTVVVLPFLWMWHGLRRRAITYLVLYVSWFLISHPSEGNGQGRPWPALENWWLWRRIFAWFPLTLEPPTKPLDPPKQYLLVLHPHGGFGFSRALFGFNTSQFFGRAFPGITFRVLTATSALRVPVIRELWLWSYCIDARKSSAIHAIKKGHSLVVYPGGVKEQILTERGKHKLYLKQRKGFCKLALQQGMPLVPIYIFGETDLYHHWSFGWKWRQKIADHYGAAIMLLSGSWGLLPYRVPVTAVVGQPVSVQKVDHPTQAQIDKLHAAYIRALQELFDAKKKSCGYENAVLEIL